MLTKKQLDLLQFIQKKIKKTGIPPSFDEMKDALNLKSKSGIHRLIIALEERGFIRRLPHRARALEVIKNINDTVFTRSKTEKNIRIFKSDQADHNNKSPNYVPILGRIAAGTPIEAISDFSNQIDIPSSMMGQGKYFALEVKGESMIEAGINNGDIVVIKEQNQANNGDIVVALIEDQEATLKKLQKKGNYIELEAANHKYQKQMYEAAKVTIQGKLIGLMRTYQ